MVDFPEFTLSVPSLPSGWSSPVNSKASAPLQGGLDPIAIIDEKLSPDEARSLRSAIQETLHAFSYDPTTDTWSSRNDATQVVFTYTRDGMASFSDGRDSFGRTLPGIGRDGNLARPGKGQRQPKAAC